MRKVAVIGCGRAGSSIAYTIANRQLCDEIILSDVDENKLKGELYDITDSCSFLDQRVRVRAGGYEACAEADAAVIAAGAATRPGQSAEENLRLTIKICRTIVNGLLKYDFQGLLFLISNKEDTVLKDLLEYSGLPSGRILGVGNTLNTNRLKVRIGEILNTDPRDIQNLYIIGDYSHPSATFQAATVLGQPLLAELKKHGVSDPFSLIGECAERGRAITRLKYSTYYGIASATADVLEAVFKDENKCFPLSVFLDGVCGESGIYASVPVKVGRKGAACPAEIELSEEEKERFRLSAERIREEDRMKGEVL